MSHVTIRRATMRWGGMSIDGATPAFGSVPGAAVYGGARCVSADAALFLPADYLGTAEIASRRLTVPRHGKMAPSAIAIAADSPIQSCDLAIGGRNGEGERFRLSPGNPWVGCSEDDFAWVSLPNGIPPVSRGSTILNWDAEDQDFGSGVIVPSFPLRLELHYGIANLPRAHVRAPYTAHMIANAVSGATRRLRVVVDGRRRIDVVHLADGSGVSTLTANAIEPMRTSNAFLEDALAVPLVLDDIGSTSLALSPGGASAQQIVSFYGNPMTVLDILLTQSGGANCTAQLRVRAYDE